MTVSNTDVIVVGGGGAGLSAAVTAAEAGASVLLIESEDLLGGSTRLSSGLFSAGGTSVQAALGVQDSPAKFYQHYMDLNGWRMEPGVVRSFCEEAAPAFEWLLGLGVKVPPAISTNAREPGLNQAGVGDVWRAHAPDGEGAAIVAVLAEAARARGVRVLLGTRVGTLLLNGDRVVGVRAGDAEYRARAVVITTGGLSHDKELLARYYPRALQSENLFPVAAPASRGDHIRLGEVVGAAVAGYVGGGNSVANAITMGHVAGRGAAAR
jgi:succinate dehydrogenase/fumarate reductase flavoprotein subunit